MRLKATTVSILQGLGWAITGIWPLVHMPSFIWVTGPKTDLWLVRTVGILITVIGLVLLSAGVRRRVTREIRGLAIGAAAGLIFIDVYYSLTDVISDIYLLDAAVETLLIGLWLWAGNRGLDESKAEAPHGP